MAEHDLPSPEVLRQLLDYDPDTGVLTWKPRAGKWSTRWNPRYAGAVAGTALSDGSIAVKIFDQNLLAHRIIWAMERGEWPDAECIIHRNGNRGDNRLRNLRDMSRLAVQRRPGLYRHNTSGIRGVSWNRFTRKWVASIRVDDVQIYLGSFDDKEAAAKARRTGERKRDRLGL